jgi:hypothetical protein
MWYFINVFEWAWRLAVVVIAIALVVIAHAWTYDIAEGSTYQHTPYERIQSETDELYRIGGEQEVRAYASREACLSVHVVDDDLVLYWWCERFKMIEEAHRITP